MTYIRRVLEFSYYSYFDQRARQTVRVTLLGNNLYRYYNIPDVRDGLTELERTILYVLYECRKEYGDRHIPTFLVWGRVVEILDVSHEHFMQGLKSALKKNALLAPAPPPREDGIQGELDL